MKKAVFWLGLLVLMILPMGCGKIHEPTNSTQVDQGAVNEISKEIDAKIASIVSSPGWSSNPGDYIKEHQQDYDDVVKMGQPALDYLIDQIEKSESSGLDTWIMAKMCNDILGEKNPVKQWATGKEWYARYRDIKEFGTTKDQSFEIYLAKQLGEKLENIALQDKPILTMKDIVSYDWDLHEIELKAEFIEKSKNNNIDLYEGGCKLLGTKFKDIFVIVVNGENIYSGNFPKPMYFSSINMGAEIKDNENKLRITFLGNANDPRPDQRIYIALKEAGKLIDK